MLPVVHELAGDAIGEGGRPATELGPCLEHEHAPARVGDRGRGGQARETGAHDDDIRRHLVVRRRARAAPGASRIRIQVEAAMTARLGRGIRTTSENTS